MISEAGVRATSHVRIAPMAEKKVKPLPMGCEVTRLEGGGYSFVACLSHLTIDYAFLSRRSTVPTPQKRHLQHLGAHYVFSVCYIGTFCLSCPLAVSPSVPTIYLVGWRSFSRYYLVYQTSPCHIRLFCSCSSHTSRSSLCISHSPTINM